MRSSGMRARSGGGASPARHRGAGAGDARALTRTHPSRRRLWRGAGPRAGGAMLETSTESAQDVQQESFIRLMAETLPLAGYARRPGRPAGLGSAGGHPRRDARPPARASSATRPKPTFMDVLSPGPGHARGRGEPLAALRLGGRADGRRVPRRHPALGRGAGRAARREADRRARRRPHRLHLDGLAGTLARALAPACARRALAPRWRPRSVRRRHARAAARPRRGARGRDGHRAQERPELAREAPPVRLAGGSPPTSVQPGWLSRSAANGPGAEPRRDGREVGAALAARAAHPVARDAATRRTRPRRAAPRRRRRRASRARARTSAATRRSRTRRRRAPTSRRRADRSRARAARAVGHARTRVARRRRRRPGRRGPASAGGSR